MIKIIKKINLFLVMTCIAFLIISVNSRVYAEGESDLYAIDPTSNFFTQVEDKTPIEIVDKRDSLLANGYVLAKENDYLSVYFKAKTCGIAVYDKMNGYTWFSTYENVSTLNLTANVTNKIESGVTIEYYLVDTKGEIKSAELYFTGKYNKKNTAVMSVVDDGFDIAVEFVSYGIYFTIEVRLDEDKLHVNVPYSSIKEIPPETKIEKNKKDYKLKSICLFPYLGSENYEINGYSFIPDGSGALIRYNEDVSATAYIKKLYGDDYSFTDYTSSYYIKDNGSLSLPIYGVNHGYNQASFLCEVDEGKGSCELHSYPYMYSLVPINTTFFKYYARDTFTVELSQETRFFLNEEVYPSDYSLCYSFLHGEDANYVGMANTYKESLGLNDKTTTNTNISLRMEILGLDYKPGLFGKKYVKMTTFNDTLNIIKELEEENVLGFNITYLGWNKGGYFTDGATKAKVANLLGGKKDLKALQKYMKDKGYSIDYTVNPVVSSGYGFNAKTVKRIGLSPFEVTMKSSMEQTGYYIYPSSLSSIINKRDNRYQKLGIDSLKLDDLNVAFSYRYKSTSTYRSQMIDEMVKEISKINYNISSEKPNSYILPYITNYYDAYYESNKYIYETDSIPFMSILFGSSITQYMPNINYISDYDLSVLRMIEYNIYPSFIITEEEAYKLRYTNYEYLNSTEFSLWKELIVSMYTKTNDALKYVINANIVNHEYLASGVCKVTYSNGVKIYINYNQESVNIDGVSIEPYTYLVKGDN